LEARPAPVQLPIGAEDKFEGVVDLVRLRAITFTGDEGDAPIEGDVPPSMETAAAVAREHLVEVIAEVDDAIAEQFLEGKPVSADGLRAAIRRACLAVKVVPVLAGAALRNKGLQPLLDAVVDYLPSPVDVPPIEGTDPKDATKKLSRPPDDKAPFS